MIQTLLATALVFAQATPVAPKPPKIYKPFRYETACQLASGGQVYDDTCVVIETRETGGALRTRNIYSNKFKLTIKGRFDKQLGYLTWDNYNNREYKWDYKVGVMGWTVVMPGVFVENISWD